MTRVPQLPKQIYSSAQVRAMDRHAIEVDGIAGFTLMTRAAAASFELLRSLWPDARNLVVVCGAGNNGGDGYCLARLAHQAGLPVRVLAVGPTARLQGDALRARHECQEAGVLLRQFSPEDLRSAHVIVDALFGTGLDRPLDTTFTGPIDAINASAIPVLSLDIPSGLHADTGAVMGAAVHAHHTITFVGLKTGLFVGRGLALRGGLHFSDLGIPVAPGESGLPALERLDEGFLGEVLHPRARDAHKGDCGKVLVVGGGPGMPGAVRLCGEAALRSGAGLVVTAAQPANVLAIVSGRPELMCHGVEKANQLDELCATADVAVIGPGLGRDRWAKSLFDAMLGRSLPLLVDADALNLLAQEPRRREDWILTPHPGEAARLLGCETREVQQDRLAAVKELARKFGGVVVLKGHGTLIAKEGEIPATCDRGNPGMATAGTGDVLAGIITALRAQLGDAFQAARAGVLVHALAGDRAAQAGERGMIASDLLAHLRPWLNPPSS